MIVRAFNYKYENKNETCTNTTITGWMDTVISILTLIVIIIATFTLIASLKYVFASSITTPMDDKISSVLNSNLTNNVDNRNLINVPNPSPRGSDSWLNNVRNQAYETRRQSYLNPQLKI